MFKVFFILTCMTLCSAEDVALELFKKLSEINDQWLQLTAVPEASYLLKHPPFSSLLGYQNVNVSDVILRGDTSEGPSTTSADIRSCSDDLLQIVFNIKSSWAFQMLDSDGKMTSGIMRGGLIWPGHFDECTSAYAPRDSTGRGDFRGQYCTTNWNLNLGGKYSKLPLSIGLCIPDSCTAGELYSLGRNLLYVIERIPGLKPYSSVLTMSSVVCKKTKPPLDVPSIIYLSFTSCFIFLTVAASVLVLLKSKRKRADSAFSGEGAHPLAVQNSESPASYGAINSDPKTNRFPSVDTDTQVYPEKSLAEGKERRSDQNQEFKQRRTEDSVGFRILQCFSVIENGEKILNTDAAEGQLRSIHGVRFLSLTWVILGHTYITVVSLVGNRIDVLKEMDNIAFQGLLQSPFSVDSFFFLSGFLLAYLFLKEAERKSGKINWIYFYVHRFWRLTPAYMVVVFFYLYVFKFIGSGPFWDDTHCDTERGSWWKYLIYINNFIPIHDMCVGWSWYLANDMQFYVLSPLFLYPLYRWPYIGITILSAMLVATWTVTGVLSYIYDLIPMFVGVTQTTDFQAYSDRMWYSFDLIYDKPYCRIAPYIIGVFLGFILFKLKGRKNFMNWWHQTLGWSLASFLSLSVVYGLFRVEMSRTTSLFYNALCRSAFTLGLAWIVFVCETGHGSFITKLLSWKLFIPLSRLTYCAYLVHPVLIHAYYFAYPTVFTFTELLMVTNFMGFLLMSYGLAFAFSLVFESPLMNLEKLVLKGISR